MQQAVDAAAEALELGHTPTVFVSTAIRTPVIWAWRLHPALLLPEALAAHAATGDWRGILCHELAHVKRRDHWAALASELLLCALPWHPFVWAAKRRLAHLSELACDDWALTCGQDGPRYAESLVNLAPQRRPILAPSAATSRSGLKDRIQRVLSGRLSDPRLGLAWSGGLVLLFAALTVVAAMTQSCAPETTTTAHFDSERKQEAETEANALADEVKAGEDEGYGTKDDEAHSAASASTDDEGRRRRSLSLLEGLAKGLREGGMGTGPSFDSIVRYCSEEDVLKVVLDNWQEVPNGIKAPAKLGALRGFVGDDVRQLDDTRWAFSPLPGVLAVLHLGATDKDYDVRRQAFEYLSVIAFRNLRPGAEYEAWHSKYQNMPMEEVLLSNSGDVVSRLRESDAFKTEELTHLLGLASSEIPILRDVPAVGEQLVRDGLLDVYLALIRRPETPKVVLDDMFKALEAIRAYDAYTQLIRDPNTPESILEYVFNSLLAIRPDDTFLGDVIYPTFKDANAKPDARKRAEKLLKAFDKWRCKLSIEGYVDALALPPNSEPPESMKKTRPLRPLPPEAGGWRGIAVKGALHSLGGYKDPVVIPQLIAALDLDPNNEFESRQRIGEALQPLTEVPVDPTHDGAWWRRWWEENRGRFDPQIAAQEIPKMETPEK